MKALLLTQDDGGKTLANIEHIDEADFPAGEVTLRLSHSAINYKDALAVTGKGKIVRSFPFVPGIDLCGEVVSEGENKGVRMLATGWGIGEKHWGGYAQLARLKAKWLTPLPAEMTSAAAMTIGTAGLTAMLCISALRDSGIKPEMGPILVSGASGGVGSFAVKLLVAAGYEVVAITSPTGRDYVSSLGARDCLMREEFGADCRPLESQKWAGAIDTAGGSILARMLAELNYGGAVAACGLAGGYKLPTTVMPFILRAARLIGIDSVYASSAKRTAIWQELATTLDKEFLSSMATSIPLEEVPAYCEKLLKGETTGRILVNLEA